MDAIRSKIGLQSAPFLANAAHHRQLAQQLRERLAQVRNAGPEAAVAAQRKRGKLMVRDRMDKRIDPETPFQELSPLAAWGRHDGEVPAAGLVTGVGRISGRECVIVANDSTVKGGTYFPETIRKHVRAQEIALENRLPCVYLVDSGGVFLPLQSEVFPDREHFGRIFFNQARLSSLGIAQISAVLGMCTAGGAYVPAMSDENVIVRGAGTIYLAGPPLVKAATGEDVTPEELGGAEMHARVSGVSDHLADNEDHALRICRDIIAGLNDPRPTGIEVAPVEEPAYSTDEIYGVMPPDTK